MNDDETYVVELTPPGRAAVAVVLVDGPQAVECVGRCFTLATGKRLRELPIDRIAVGRWAGPDGEEVVVCRRAVERVEIHCHGGVAAVRAVIATLSELGCRRTDWRAWLAAAESDPIRAAAAEALASARTARVAAILRHPHGAGRGVGRAMAAGGGLARPHPGVRRRRKAFGGPVAGRDRRAAERRQKQPA
jgi:tRNA U34 5-carboxymethylaminomethyl modifying GTPase MnmE/TrmE